MFFTKPRRRVLFIAVLAVGLFSLLRLPIALGSRLDSALGAPLSIVLRLPSLAAGKLRQEWSTLINWFGLGEENRRLSHDLAQLRLEHQQLLESYQALARRQDAPRFEGRPLAGLIPAGLLARDPSTWFNYITLDKGTRDNVPTGAGVIGDQGVVGKVAAAGPLSSRVVFLIDPSCRISVRDARSKVAATLVGSGRNTCTLLYLSGQDDVRPGDLMVTAREGTLFPPGIPVGEVMRVEKKDNGLNLDAEVRPSVKLSLVEDFYVIGKAENP
jgi:rod shape-determining protein MreC